MTRNRRTLQVQTIKLAGQPFTLCFDWSALAALEDVYDLELKDLGQVFERPDPADPEGKARKPRVRMNDVRNMIWAGLRSHHKALTLDDVEGLLNSEMTEHNGKLGDVFATAFAGFNAASEDDSGNGQAAASPAP